MDADGGGGTFSVTLTGGRPWGLRLQGGYEYAQRIRVAKVGKARIPRRRHRLLRSRGSSPTRPTLAVEVIPVIS